MNKKLLAKLRHREGVPKRVEAGKNNPVGIETFRNVVRKAQAQLKLNLSSDCPGKSPVSFSVTTGRTGKMWPLLLNGTW